MAKKTNIGLVDAQPKSINQKNLDKLIDKSAFKLSIANSYVSNVGNEENFNPTTVRKTSEPYDSDTGIISDSPEIILFSNFEPTYSDNGQLNKTGEILQAKQESVLVSAVSSIEQLKKSNVFSFIQEKTKNNRDEINEFCNSFSDIAKSLLFEIENVKKNFDCRYPKILPYDENGNVDLVALQNEYDNALYDQPYEITEILHDQISIKNWSATKTWIQLCLELKEVLRRGAPTTLLTDSSNISPDKTKPYLDPYSISPSASSMVSKFGFSDSQILVPALIDLTTITSSDIDEIANKLENMFSKNMFTKNIYSDLGNVGESISRIAYLLCKEHRYSTRLKQEVLDQYGYTAEGRENSLNVWDYLIGVSGKDVTDISSNPRGAGNSLISIAQTVEQNNEVLTFEDRYITDDVGTVRPAATLTPGTYYYLESSLNANADGFDTSRLSKLIDKLTISSKMIDHLSKDIMFKSSPSPISFYSQNTGDRIVSRAKNIALNLSDDNNTFLRFNISKNILNDPISLLRTIESEVLNGTALLNRSAVTHVSKNNVFISYTNYLWSRNQDQLDGGGVPSTKKQTDVSWLLISLAMRDDKLRSLLFMHQIATLNGSINSSISKKVIKKNLDIDLGLVEVENVATMSATTSNTNLTYKEELAQKILQRIEQIIDVSTVTITNQDFVEKNAIYNALVGVNEFGLEVLNKIVVLMIKLDESGDWFKESNYRSGEISDNKLTPYSGIQKTSFYAAFFNLCCLIVHAANPERIVSRHGSKYVVKKVRKNIVTGSKEGENYVTVYDLDRILLNSEDLLWTQNNSCMKTVNTMRALLKNLKKELESLKTSLSSSRYRSFLNSVNSILKDPNLTKMLMTKEQLNLAMSKMMDYSERSRESYSSPVKSITPYFLNHKDDKDVDLLLPIEDIYMNSWNMWLKSFLSEGKFRESEAYNKKIISVGLPQKLHRRLQLDASNLKNSTFRNSLIKINVYRVDNLRPDLIHNPVTFLFDTLSYPRRILNPYLHQVNLMQNVNINDSQTTRIKDLPIIKAPKSSNGKFEKTIIKSFSNFLKSLSKNSPSINSSASEEADSDIKELSDSDKILLSECHKMSFMMEIYLKFITDYEIEENRFLKYSEIDKKNYSNVLVGGQKTSIRNSSQRFFVNETFAGDVNQIKRSLIMPKKFDRVFHLLVDPDDFTVNIDLTPKSTIDKYLSNREIREVSSNDSSVKSYKRIPSRYGEITFDKYFVAIETYNENSVSS